jgi:hypothetical protein
MLDSAIIEQLRIRYPDCHPLLFHRSVERAKSNGDLFDILDTIPNNYPIVWCESTNRWITAIDLYLSDGFFEEEK